MKIKPDEEPYRHEARWIGTGAFVWFHAARYKTWGTGAGVVAVILLVLFVSRPANPLTVYLGCMAAVVITKYISSIVTHDRPLRSLPGPLWTELTAPRRVPTASHTRTDCVHRVRIRRDI